jgi:hypothetical protein
MSTIPISEIVTMQPGVVDGGGAPSLITGLVLTQDPSVPLGDVLIFGLTNDVIDWFGPESPEATLATYYFPGTVNGGQLPFDLQFARYDASPSPAEVFGAQLNITLAQLKALTGTLIVTTAALHTSSTINLSAATDFNSAAALMLAGFTSPDFTITYDAQRGRFLLATTATGSTVEVSPVTGTLADGVGLSAASGAVLQGQGAAGDTTIGAALDRALNSTTNFGTFTTAWVPAIADRLALAQHNSTLNFEFLYVSYDLEAASTIANNTAAFGSQVFAAPYQGTLPLYGDQTTAGAAMGYAAAINFDVPNGRATLAFRQSAAGAPATASSVATSRALLSNNYTYIGAYANAANNYTIFYDGKCSGEFLWTDTYLDQIYLNRELQRAFFESMLAYNSLPYNADGYTAEYRAGVDVIDAAITSGIIRAGVTLSQNQQQLVNSQAGRVISDMLQSVGWYLLIGDPANPAQARQNRTSPAAALWYCDGGSIQKLNVASRAVI